MSRKVMISKRGPTKVPGKMGGWEWNTMGVATFHDFAIDHVEYSNGIGNFPCVIVGWDDGTVESIPLSGYFKVQFLTEDEAS